MFFMEVRRKRQKPQTDTPGIRGCVRGSRRVLPSTVDETFTMAFFPPPDAPHYGWIPCAFTFVLGESQLAIGDRVLAVC